MQEYAYDAVGNITAVTDPNGNTTRYEYSPSGNLTAVIDAVDDKTEYAYDAYARLSTIFRHEGKETLLGSDGNLLPVSSPFLSGQLRLMRYERDAMGTIIRVIDPLSREETFAYDPMDQLTKKTDKDGYQTQYSYTQFKKVGSITYHDGRSVIFSYNALRRLVSVQDWLGTTAIESDRIGRVQKVTDHAGREVSYQWNQTGEREAVVYPGGKESVLPI